MVEKEVKMQMGRLCAFLAVVIVVCWLLSVITSIALFQMISTGAIIVLGITVIIWAGKAIFRL